MDGLAATREIRRFEASQAEAEAQPSGTGRKRPAVIAALTGLAGADVYQEALRSGVDMFLTKPVMGVEVRGILERALLEGENETEGQAQDEVAETGEEETVKEGV